PYTTHFRTPVGFVDAVELGHIPGAVGQLPDLATLAVEEVEVVVAVPLARPDAARAAGDPGEVVVDVDPLRILAGHDDPRPAGPHVREHDLEPVLVAVQPLDHQLVGRRGPIHPRQVDVGVGACVDPNDAAIREVDDADPRDRVRLPRLRVAQWDRLGVQPQIVDHVEDADRALVEAPEGDLRPVRAPAPAVAQPELFLVDPVEGPV